MPKLQQWIAKANEYGLYVLLLAQPITGLGDVVFHGRPFTLFIWQVPALLAPDPAIRSLFQEAHELGAKALLVLIGLHAGAALFHGLVLRDGVLQRMLPLSIGINFLSARDSAGRRTRMLVGRFGIKSPLEKSGLHIPPTRLLARAAPPCCPCPQHPDDDRSASAHSQLTANALRLPNNSVAKSV